MLLPVLLCHLRFHKSLAILEGYLGYKFSDRSLLQVCVVYFFVLQPLYEQIITSCSLKSLMVDACLILSHVFGFFRLLSFMI